MRSEHIDGEWYRTISAHTPETPALNRAMEVVLHFQLLLLLGDTEAGVKCGRIRLRTTCIMEPRRSQGKKIGTGNPNLRKRTQDVIGLAALEEWSMVLLQSMVVLSCSLEK